MRPVNVAMIGVGCISGIYLQNIHGLFQDRLRLVGVCDLVRERAEKAQKDYNVPKLYETMHEAFADPEVEVVLNLTRPYEHFEVAKAALLAGKHVFTEKPLGATFEEGEELVRLAIERGLRIGGAPDTFLGAGIQQCRKLIDSGAIGTPLGAAGFMISHGPETWHPDPEFFYHQGGGPMMDMGPYYVTALVNLLGRVRSVQAFCRASFPTRTITSEPHNGTVVDVTVPTYYQGILEFESGAVGSLFTTFDVHHPYAGSSRIEVYGSDGTLFVPDPNCFDGEIKLLKPGLQPQVVPERDFAYRDNSRGIGLADFAVALRGERGFARADMQQVRHVLEILTSFEKASNARRALDLATPYTRRPVL